MSKTISQSASIAPKTNVLRETTCFLKQQLNHIIRQELRNYNEYAKMEGELEQHRKQEEIRKMNKSIFEGRMQQHKSALVTEQKRKSELLEKKQKERVERMQYFQMRKRGAHQEKFSAINRSLRKVKLRYESSLKADSQSRLSRVALNSSEGPRCVTSAAPRSLNTSRSEGKQEIINEIARSQENSLVTKYMNKVSRSESRMMEMELNKENRIQEGKRHRVKCLVGQRKKKEEDFMQQAEAELSTRMGRFELNHSRLTQMKDTAILKKAMSSDLMQETVLRRREQFQQKQIQGILKGYNSHASKAAFQNYRSFADLNYSRSNMRNNLERKKEEETVCQLQSDLKLLTEKVRKVNNVQYGQRLDEHTLNTILGMMDPTDPDYTRLCSFLKSERRAFVEGLAKEEEKVRQERLKKMGKSAGRVPA